VGLTGPALRCQQGDILPEAPGGVCFLVSSAVSGGAPSLAHCLFPSSRLAMAGDVFLTPFPANSSSSLPI
jgi:hypothetical protein